MSLDELKTIKDAFVQELNDSDEGNTTSLPFIRHTLAQNSLVTNDEVFQALVIGGSYYQKAIMKSVDGQVSIVYNTQGEQPPFLSKATLLSFIEEHVDAEVKTLALNFAYPIVPLMRDNKLDGTLLSGSKENTFEDLVGANIGETVEQYFQTKLGRTIQVSVANDTICLLLSGLTQQPWDHLAAGVVGTGINFAIFLDEKTVVNLEAGAFDKFTQSEAGLDIDKFSASPGADRYEKEISGAYLFKQFNYFITKQKIPLQPIGSSKQLDYLVSAPNAQIAQLAKDVLQHSAELVAAQVAGILEFSGRDLTFIMQGSLYWKGFNYKETIEKIVTELSPTYKATYVAIEHSDLFGAAKLVA